MPEFGFARSPTYRRYRHRGDVELDTVSSSDQVEAQLEMNFIEQEIRSHRENCFLCREILLEEGSGKGILKERARLARDHGKLTIRRPR